jgi:hypothetical protein
MSQLSTFIYNRHVQQSSHYRSMPQGARFDCEPLDLDDIAQITVRDQTSTRRTSELYALELE